VNGQSFAQATLLEEPFNSASNDSDFTLSPDGNKAMFWRSIGEVATIHIAYRVGRGWSVPKPLPAEINLGPFNFTPSFGNSGRTIRYATTLERPGQPSGMADIQESPLPARD
jgi:hypothetical protein